MARFGRLQAAALAVAFGLKGVAGIDLMSMSDEELMEGTAKYGQYETQLHPCPVSCDGREPSKWTVYPSVERLARCNESLLFDFAIDNVIIEGKDEPIKVRACSTNKAKKDESEKRQEENPAKSCAAGAREDSLSLNVVSHGEPREDNETADNIQKTLKQVQTYFTDNAECDEDFMFSYSSGVIAGVYAGASFDRSSVVSVVERLSNHINSDSASDIFAELCGEERNAHHVLGVAISANNITSVQEAVKSWNSGACATGFVGTSEVTLDDITVWEAPYESVRGNMTRRSQDLHRRAECEHIKVVHGDTCGTLTKRCGISPQDLVKYNRDDLCSNRILKPGEPICCTDGDMPDLRPAPQSDGTCATHRVIKGDTCSALAAANGLEIEDIEEFNEDAGTWGWYDCDKLQADVNICLSKGKAPMPYPIENALCGPTVPGTEPPEDGEDLADLNPCPLNVCCNIWGQCGITEDFCTESQDKNPGTSTTRNGCVSSCGTDIVNKDDAPGHFGRIGYYESWNYNRECLNMRVTNANTDGSYNIIHWAFAEINFPDLTVKIVDEYDQWEDFKKMSEHKVVSFGGWAFSNEPSTYNDLREAMSPTNRETFARNVAKFVDDEGLDGVDYDWEYPGATDIPGTPPGHPDDTINYLKFLTVQKEELTQGKTLSIAAPASYWYLKPFPIAKMAEVLDYIVYMTYDLHGQWDVGNEWASPGCKTGNCLRSHVNLTETLQSLSMITKAGVPTNRIFVGESSYGRSFKMADAGCKDPDCLFLGDRLNSPAKPGRCTATGGYISNAELQSLKYTAESYEEYYDFTSNSDVIIYDGTEWVGYMTPGTKTVRRILWNNYNFAGTIDWAVDLQAFTDDDLIDPTSGENIFEDEEYPDHLANCPNAAFFTLDDIERMSDVIDDHCLDRYILQVLQIELDEALSTYDELLADGYDKKFDTYAAAVARSGDGAVEKFMEENGDDFFSCEVTEKVWCCPACEDAYDSNPGNDVDRLCRYCENWDCGFSETCGINPRNPCRAVEYRWTNISDACPPDYSKRTRAEPPTGGFQNAIYWTMNGGNAEDEFYAMLYKETGISKEDITWGNNRHQPCYGDDCEHTLIDYNFPKASGFEADDVQDPKDVVSDARDNIGDVSPDMSEVIRRIANQMYSGSTSDLVDALALPIFIIKDAVSQMGTISDLVEEWEEEKRKNIILAFLTAIFFFIPIAGQLIGTVTALASIGRVIATLGAMGQLATDIYALVESEGNPLLDIFAIVLAPLAIFDIASIGRAARARRGMSGDEVASLGKRISGNLNKVDDLKAGRVCSRRNNKRSPSDLGLVEPVSDVGLEMHAINSWDI